MKESELKFFNVFIRFLKEKKIYGNFIENYVNYKVPLTIERRFRSPYNFVSSAFVWDGSNEGGGFWCDLSNEWQHINDNFWKNYYEYEIKMSEL